MKDSFAAKGGGWVVAQAVVMVAVISTPLFGQSDWPGSWHRTSGAILIAFGAAAGIAGAVTLGRNRTAYPVPIANAELIQHGIYGRIRHPLYTSLILLGFGWALWWASPIGLAVSMALTLLLNAKAGFEEQKLRGIFTEYEGYQNRVPRFCPHFTGRSGKLPLAILLTVGFRPIPNTAAAPAGPLRLAAAIAETQANNPDVMLARNRIAAAAAAVRQADAMLWPQLSLRSGYQRTDNPIGVFGAALNQRSFSPSLNFNDVPDADNLNLGAVVTVPLYTGGQVSAARRAAREHRTADTHVLAAVRNQLAFEAARTFFTIQKTRAFIEAATAAVHGFTGNLDIARKRFATGKALKADVLDIEVRLAQAREELLQARNAHELARRALANLLGRETGLPVIATESVELDIPAESVVPQRPETAALNSRRTAAKAGVRSARSGFAPKVSAFASTEHNRGWQFNGQGNSYTAGVLVNWKLWDGFLTRGKVDEARANENIVTEQQRRLRLAINLEVQQSRLKVKSATERVAVTRKAVELANESVQLTRVRFEQGLALATQLIDSETALTGARVRVAQADTDRLIAIAQLRQALGLPQLTPPSSPVNPK